MKEHDVKIWLVNTGWTGGPYGVGSRMKLPYTRAMITAALEGELDDVEYVAHKTFGVLMPKTCPGVPSELLSPRHAWKNEDEYDIKAKELASQFRKNFEKYADGVNDEILAAAPTI